MTESDTTPSQRKRPPPTPLYRNTGGEAAIRAVYDRLLAALPYEHEQRLVQTSFGTAHVLVCGPVDAEPLVLWHGMGAPGPTMLEGFAPLISRFRTYVPDMPYQGASRSEDALLDPSTHEHGKWALEVLQGLGLVPGDRQGNKGALSNGKGGVPPVPLHAGVSFGGAVLLDLANVAPEAIRGAALIVPGGLVPGSAWCMPCLLLPSMLYRLLPCPFTAWLALVGMCDEPVPEQLELILLEWRYVAAHSPLPGGNAGFSKAQLSRLTAPTLVIAAEKDVFWPGKAVAAAAEASLPACKTMVIPGRHLPSRAKLAECMEEVLSFWAVSKLI